MLTPMVHGIIQHDQRVTPPLVVVSIQMVDELAEEEAKGHAVSLPIVDGIKDFIAVTNSSYDVELGEPLGKGDLVLNPLYQPPSLPTVSGPEVALIHIDDTVVAVESLNELGRSNLP